MSMRTGVTADEIASYRANGFLAMPDLLDPDELAEWRSAIDEAVAERISRFSHPGGGDQPVDAADQSYYDRVFTQRVNLWQTSSRVRALMTDSRLGKLAADLAGVDGIRIWH